MIINKKSLHYKLYESTYKAFDGYVPEKTNLCQYMRRLLVFSLLVYPFLLIVGIAFIIILVFITALMALPMLLVGKRPQMPWEENYTPMGAKNLPPLRIGKFNFYLVYLVIPFVLYVLVRYDYHLYHTNGFFHPFLVLQSVFVTIAVVVLGLLLRYDTETGQLIGKWFEAKTQGVCPLITFEGTDNKNETE